MVKAKERINQRVRPLAYTYRYATDRTTAAAERAVLSRLLRLWSTEPPAPVTELADNMYVCFFDGGSRGYRGPGGAGSVLVAVDMGSRMAQVLWFAVMAYGNRTTTNNVAGY